MSDVYRGSGEVSFTTFGKNLSVKYWQLPQYSCSETGWYYKYILGGAYGNHSESVFKIPRDGTINPKIVNSEIIQSILLNNYSKPQ